MTLIITTETEKSPPTNAKVPRTSQKVKIMCSRAGRSQISILVQLKLINMIMMLLKKKPKIHPGTKKHLNYICLF